MKINWFSSSYGQGTPEHLQFCIRNGPSKTCVNKAFALNYYSYLSLAFHDIFMIKTEFDTSRTC